MMSQQHTPGPWAPWAEAQANARLIAAATETAAERDHLRSELLELNEVHFAALMEKDRLKAVNEELLAACERAVTLLEPFDDPGLSLGLGSNALKPIRAALARAKGGAA